MCKVFKVVLFIKDFDEIGFDKNRLINQLHHAHIPEYIDVYETEAYEVGVWSRMHELNYKITPEMCEKYFNDKTRCVD